MRFFIPLLAFVLSTLWSGAQTKCDTIPWTPSLKLTWADFNGAPDNSTSFKALTSSGIHFGTSSNGKQATFETSSKFMSCLSWTKVNSDSVLEHEQLHFDITECFRRALLQRLSKVTFTKKNFSDKMQDVYKEVNGEWKKEQDDYDRETDHGINHQKQVAWENRIHKLLQSLDEFSKPNLTVEFK